MPSTRLPSAASWTVLVLLAAMLAFGGAAQFFLLQDIPARIAAAVLAGLVLWHSAGAGAGAGTGPLLPRALGWALAGLIAIPLFQLLPLPHALWSLVPGTDRAQAILDAAGAAEGWQVLSVAPSRTFDSLLFLLAGLAACLLGYQADRALRDRVLMLVVAAAVVSLLLGLFQLLEGAGGVSYFYEITNDDSAVGLFANRNHNGLFMAIAIVLLWPVAAARDNRGAGKGVLTPAVRYGAMALGAVLLIGVALTNSRAALGLGCLALVLLVAALLWAGRGPGSAAQAPSSDVRQGGARSLARIIPLLLVAISLAVMGGAALMIGGSLSEEGFNRAEAYPIIVSAMKDYWLFGSGLGSFDWAARPYEDRATITYAYWNHAHNDAAQIVVEAGLLGVAVLAAAVLWYVRAARDYVRSLAKGRSRSPLIEAALAALLLVAGHSLVDYPLRTAAISAVVFLLIGMVEAEKRRRSSSARTR